MNPVISIENSDNRAFNFELLPANNNVYSGNEPVVRVYDAKHTHAFLGQVICGYYVNSLLNPDYDTPINERLTGLQFYGGVPEWYMDYSGLMILHAWLLEQIRGE